MAGVELVGFTDGVAGGCGDDDLTDRGESRNGICAVAGAWGEGSIGLTLELTYDVIEEQPIIGIGGGVVIRIPATFGFGFLWALDLL